VKANSGKSWVLAWLAVAAAGAATLIDVPAADWAHDSGIAAWLSASPHVARVLRFEGHFAFTATACIGLLVGTWARGVRRGPELWEKPGLVLLAGALSGLNAILKWCFGRIRPFHGVPAFALHPFRGGIHGLFVQDSLSFPSGDTTMAFAMAASMSLVAPRLWPLWWVWGIIVAVERVAQNSHYPSDALAGAALGIGLALVAQRIVGNLSRGAGDSHASKAMTPSGELNVRAS
jgi:undecaprenyl-diphosphatase